MVWTVQTIVFSGWISLKLVAERCVVCSIRFIIIHSGVNYFNGKLNPTSFFKLTVDLEVQKLKKVPVHYITCHKLECCKEEWSDVNRKREISGWRNLSLFLFGWTHERNSVMKETLGQWVIEGCEVFAAAINKLVHQREKFINFAVNIKNL